MPPARLFAPVTVVFLLLLSTPGVASCFQACGSGDAFSPVTEYLYRGQAVSWETTLYVDRRAAGPEDGPFYAYLIDAGSGESKRPLVDRRPVVDDGVLLGEVVATPSARRNILDVALSFTVPPDAALGRHLVEVCNSPCDTRLAYMTPTEVVVADDEGGADLEYRLDRLTLRVDGLKRTMPRRASRIAIEKIEPAIDDLRTSQRLWDVALEDRIAVLEGEVEELSASQPAPERERTVESGFLLVVLVSLAGAVAWSRRRALTQRKLDYRAE